MKKKKRNRGGQKGNQNARTNGFYASSLIPRRNLLFPLKFPDKLQCYLQNRLGVVFPFMFGKIAKFSLAKGANS